MQEQMLESIIFGLKATIEEQKAEIERLTEENIALSKGVKRLKKRYEETIKRNVDECVKKFCETTMYTEQERLVKENAELQKQVNGLKEENKALYEERTALIAGTILERKDIIKDTAKEILDELKAAKQYAKDFYGVAEKVGVDIAINVVKKIFKQKGVEVE